MSPPLPGPIGPATTAKRGTMSAADKTKLDALPANATLEARLLAIEAAEHSPVTLDPANSSWLTLAGQVLKLTLVAASAVADGIVTQLAQTFAGVKTFANGLIASAAVTINSYLLVTGAPPGNASLTDGQSAYLGSYNNNIGSAALWLAVTPGLTNYAVAMSTSGGLGTPVGTTLAGTPAIVMGRNGTVGTDVCTKVGTNTADGSVNASAKLLSVRTGIGGTEVESLAFYKGGTIGGANGLLIMSGTVGTRLSWVGAMIGFGEFVANQTALRSSLGAGASDVGNVIGFSTADGSVHATAHLASFGAGIGGTYAEKWFATKTNIEATTADSGVILKSPDGTRWRLTISNAGAVTVALA